ncbi:MAG: ATP-binding protein [Thermodesulfobacteriota bacterium]
MSVGQEKTSRSIRELEEKIRVLEVENELLIERGEDTLLLSLISEQINNLAGHDDILDIALEQISVLKGIFFSASAQLDKNLCRFSRTFCSLRSDGLEHEEIRLSPEIVAELEFGPVMIDCRGEETSGASLSGLLADLSPLAVLLIPTRGRMFPDGLFIFGEDLSPDSLLKNRNLLQRAVEMVADRLDNLILLDQVSELNQELDRKVEQKTEELRHSENLYRSLVENIDLGVTLIDAEHNVAMANSAQGRMFGKDPSSFIGRKCFREFEKRDNICEHCPGTKAMQTGLPAEAVAHGQKEDGSEITARIRAFPLIADDEVKGFIEVVEDVTEKIQAEEDMQRAMKLESMGVLAGGIAHDFNNLLTAVLGNVSLLKLGAEPNDKIYSKLTEVEKATLRARKLTQQLLTFAKGGSPVKQTTSVKELAVDAATFALRGAKVQCRFDFSDDLWLVDVDPGQFTQVIQNLAINASQAMPAGGLIYLAAENFEHESGDPYILLPGKYIKVSVRDEGEGIEHEVLAKIFDPYFTTKEKGTGIGLATAYSIAKNHGGLLTVDSTPGSGSTFYFYLPVSEQANGVETTGRQVVPDQQVGGVSSGKGKILLMDDEEIILEVTGEMLRYAGYEIAQSRSGQEAVEEYRQAMATGEAFDAVILDLTVPGEGWGGEKTLEKLKELDPEVKVVLSSGYANDPVMIRFREYGFLAAVAKPYRIERLSKVLGEVLATK